MMMLFSLIGCTKTVEQQIAEQLELGQKYLAEANYEEAVIAFNKVIELVGSAKDLTLENVNIIPLTNSEGTSFGGSIYFNVIL